MPAPAPHRTLCYLKWHNPKSNYFVLSVNVRDASLCVPSLSPTASASLPRQTCYNTPSVDPVVLISPQLSTLNPRGRVFPFPVDVSHSRNDSPPPGLLYPRNEQLCWTPSAIQDLHTQNHSIPNIGRDVPVLVIFCLEENLKEGQLSPLILERVQGHSPTQCLRPGAGTGC